MFISLRWSSLPCQLLCCAFAFFLHLCPMFLLCPPYWEFLQPLAEWRPLPHVAPIWLLSLSTVEPRSPCIFAPIPTCHQKSTRLFLSSILWSPHCWTLLSTAWETKTSKTLLEKSWKDLWHLWSKSEGRFLYWIKKINTQNTEWIKFRDKWGAGSEPSNLNAITGITLNSTSHNKTASLWTLANNCSEDKLPLSKSFGDNFVLDTFIFWWESDFIIPGHDVYIHNIFRFYERITVEFIKPMYRKLYIF